MSFAIVPKENKIHINLTNHGKDMSDENFKMLMRGLLWWLSGKESACQWGRHRFNTWSGKIPQTTEQLRLCATTPEPVLWSPGATAAEPVCHNYWRPCTLEAMPRSKIREATTMRSHCTATKERHPLSITRQKLAQQWRPSTTEKQKMKCCERNSAISYLLISRTLKKAFVAPDLLL